MRSPNDEDTALEREIADIRERIVAQANAAREEGWLHIPVPPEIAANGQLRVPRGAFEMWAVARCAGGHLAVPWTPIAPQGMKMRCDDQFHTDWMLGAGLSLDAIRAYSSNPHWRALTEAVENARFAVQEKLLKFRCSVLLPGDFIMRRVFVPKSPADLPEWGGYDETPPVALIPNAGSDYLDLAVRVFDMTGAVIAEEGGEMAHLVTALRPSGRGPLIRIPKARQKYPPGARLHVEPDNGTVSLADEFASAFANNPDPFRDGRRYLRTSEDDPVEPPQHDLLTPEDDLIEPSQDR